jgi:AraC-like DNA-binding protein
VRDPIVKRALTVIHERKAHRWTLPELAREVGASRSAFAKPFSRAFKREFGLSPLAWHKEEHCLLG